MKYFEFSVNAGRGDPSDVIKWSFYFGIWTYYKTYLNRKPILRVTKLMRIELRLHNTLEISISGLS